MDSYSHNEEVKIKQFLDIVKFKLPIINEAEKEIDRFLSRKHNVFNYIQPNEMALSKIVSDFLDSKGDHGQGSVFLDLFLKEFVAKNQLKINTKNTKVFLEHCTDSLSASRRIDIVLQFDNGFTIGIENKPWAGEQKDQLKDYGEHLKNVSGEANALIYLMGDVDRMMPKELLDKVVYASYREQDRLNEMPSLESWLLECAQACQSIKFKQFIEEFYSYVLINFEVQEEK